jgi:hypothetical protein
MHPDLHAANVLIDTLDISSAFTMTGILDWQSATVRPLFESALPAFLEEEHSRAKSEPSAGPPLPPLDPVAYGETENSPVHGVDHYLSCVRNSWPELAFVMRSDHMELLRQAIYYSSHTWSDGLPNLDRVLEQFCEGYGTNFPVNEAYPTCPIDFPLDEASKARRAAEYHEYVNAETQLEWLARGRMEAAGIEVGPSGYVDAQLFEYANQEAEKVFEYLTEKMTEKRKELFAKRLWAFRKDRFDLMSESCVD